ncbi:peptidase metallopeptidase [Crinalium epipsammum PCC 9333]|uniref:Peptidase metallopeptidase n=1 Tax=Crinalium epipsammum PCC 9333 TaxID=1173022 RepID=K9W084_9CYAN|nr:matrixin family metalloprotease [Crinalium epipsammum]AFZ13152.1 peptidase metallopeptidase [Crinalium epipsammum PCC 9333]
MVKSLGKLKTRCKKVKVRRLLSQIFLLPFYWLFNNFWQRRLLLAWGLSICSCLFVIFTNIDFASASLDNNPALPSLKAHPLPTQLAKWQDVNNFGDYFSEIKPTKLGYLVWSEFPVKVYIERPTETDNTSASLRRFEQWVEAALKAVQEWNNYLPLVVVEQRENADIIFLRSRPPLKPSINPNTGELQLPRARSAQTNYEFYLKKSVSNSPVLSHKFTILISPDPALAQIQSAACHELGHALGIWGHSSLETDVMYFSQVRNPPPISARDINTLKRIYQQPTRLGWFIKTK